MGFRKFLFRIDLLHNHNGDMKQLENLPDILDTNISILLFVDINVLLNDRTNISDNLDIHRV